MKKNLSEFRPFCCKLCRESRRALDTLTARPNSNGEGAIIRALLLEAVAPILIASKKGTELARQTRAASKAERRPKKA